MARPSHPNRLGGFTLVELMVVIVLIGIMTAMIVPEMKGTFEDALLRSTSRELSNAFGIASSRAVSLNRVHRVRFDPRTGRYLVEMRGRPGEPEFVPLPDVPGAQGELDSRIAIQIRDLSQTPADSGQPSPAASLSGEPDSAPHSAAAGISFYSDSTADGAEISLRDRQGFRLSLRINPITARVHVHELPRQ